MNKILTIKLTILLLLSSYILFGQKINGRILDLKSNLPIEYVNVYFFRKNTGTISNKEGVYKLDLASPPSINDTLRFSKIGFKTQEITYDLLLKNKFLVYLEMKIDTINEVTVNSQKLRSSIKYVRLSQMKKGIFSFGSVIINDSIYIIGGDLSIENKAHMRALSNASVQNKELTIQDINREIFRSDNTNIKDFSDQIYIYDIEKNSYYLSPISIDNRANHNAVFLNNMIYIIGGKTMSKHKKYQYLCNTIEAINVSNDQKTTYKMNPHQAVNFASAVYRNYIFVMGGSTKENDNGTKEFSNKSHFLNVVTGDWFELTDMPTHKETRGVIVDNKIFLIGGYNGNPLSTVDSFNMISGEWKNEGRLSTSIANPALTAKDSIIYIFGNSELILLNTTSGSYREYKINLPLKNSQIHYYKNNLFILGGFIEDRFSKIASGAIYKVDLNELNQTISYYKRLEKLN